MVNQVLVNVKTSEGIWETTFQRFKDAFSVAKRSQACFMQARVAPCRFWPGPGAGKL